MTDHVGIVRAASTAARGVVLAAVLAAAQGAGNPALAAAAPTPHSVEELTRPLELREATLSPDGKWVALARRENGGGDQVIVVDAERAGEEGSTRVVGIGGGQQRFRVRWLAWANERRLLVGIAIAHEIDIRQWGLDNAFTDGENALYRTIAVDYDGTKPALMFGGDKMALGRSRMTGALIDLTPDDPKTVVMVAIGPKFTRDLYKVDVDTGVAEPLQAGVPNTWWWVTENGRPAIRQDLVARDTALVYNAATANGWQEIARLQMRDPVPELRFEGDAPGPNTIYVRMRRDGDDKATISVYDFVQRKPLDVVASHPDYDMESALVFENQYYGAAWIADRTAYRMADPRLQPHVDGLAKYFGDQVDMRIHGIDRGRTRLLIEARGPSAPSDWYVYDVAKRDVKFVASSRPWLDPARLPRTDARTVKARDGLPIRAYVTAMPGASGPRPLVMMPHGGPEVRDGIEFDVLVQSLAAQGWVVVQPNFRGSYGYGRAFAAAGWKQWGRRMQEDLDDTIDDLVAAGIADPKRVAIVGASYGGYAALAGAAFTPDRYRAAVSIAGIANIVDILQKDRVDYGRDSSLAKRETERVGDVSSERAELERWSPSEHAANVRIPILLVHGTRDDVVPYLQTQLMQSRLKSAGKSVQVIEFRTEGHRDWSPASEAKLAADVVTFLRPHLK